jgi:DNA-binding winged helix-turn-helix (wHTH) protein
VGARLARIVEIVRKPSLLQRSWKDKFVVSGPLDPFQMLRVIFEKENGNIVVVTFYPVRRRRYESKLR